VFSQHEYYFNEIANPTGYRNPRDAFYEDLDVWINKWTEDGDQIILGLDANEDIHTGKTLEWTSQWGLIDVMATTHPQRPRTATCNKNYNNIPIDGIWCSPSLVIHSAGMTGFGELHPDSDHRILWADITKESLFGFPVPGPEKRPVDSLPIKNPMAMRKYNNYVKNQFEIHKITEKTFDLEQKAQNGCFTIHDATQYNNILMIQHKIRQRARQKCRRFFTSQILYTDTLGKIYRRRKLWKLMGLKRQHVKVDIRAIRRLMQQVDEPDAFRISNDEIQKRLDSAVSDWKDYKKNHQTLREAFEKKVDRQRAIKYGTSVETQTKQRSNISSTRAIFKRIRLVMKPSERTAISTIEYTSNGGDTIECISREDIEQACAAEGQRRFTQAQATPFLQGSLLQTFGFNANPTATQAVLNGTFVPGEDVSLYTTQFIQELSMPASIKALPAISGTVTTDAHCAGWKKMRVNTGSSPYGPLFCDYIAGLNDPEVAAVDASLSSIPYMIGLSPSQWQEAADVMIPKKKSSRHVEKLRIIVLFDAMFNMANKRIAREMIQRAVTLKILPDEAYGGVPGRRASTCSLNKILALDILRIERRPAAVCSNDAKSCYDRIVHTVASLCMQRLGVNEHACFTMFATLQALQHHVRTAFGETANGYGALGIPLHGVGQGNGAGPAIWLAITMPLIAMLRKAGFGLQVVTPISQETATLACFAYVDDVDSIHAPLEGETLNDITAGMQRMLDTWTGGLHATGGMIESSKSYWYLIDFKWNRRKMSWEYKSIQETPATIYLRQPGQSEIPLQRKEAWDPDPDGTLGTYIAMDGNQRLVVDSLTKKINEWADKIRTRQLTATEGWLSLRSGISMSIQYQLTTSRLTKRDCRKITRNLKQAALRAGHMPLTFPDSLVYAPKEFLGLGLPDLWHIQSMLFAEQCLRYGSLPSDPTGILLRTVIQYMRLEMGVQKSPFCYSFEKWNKCVTPNQFIPFWEYASAINLELHDGLPDTPIARKHDRFIMEVFAEAGFTSTQLRMLNLCRMYLRIYLLSDLTTGEGAHLDKQLLARRHPFEHHPHIRWPRAHPPGNHCWTLWTEAIIKCFTRNHLLQPYRLQTPLTSWYGTLANTHANTVYSPSCDTIYIRTAEGKYQQFRRQRSRSSIRPSYDRDMQCESIPIDAIPTTTEGNCQRIRHTGISGFIPYPATADPEWWGIIVSCSLPIMDLIAAIRQGTAIALTDGSYKDGMGTAAFTFRTSTEDHRELSFVHMTPGMEHELTPYRAEVGGLYGIAVFIQRVTKGFDCTGGRITIACDCKGALDRVFDVHPPLPKQSEYDLLSEIYHIRKSNQLQWTKHWVKGHQDHSTPFYQLDNWARLNIAMDTLAKQHWSRLDRNRPRPFSLPSSNGTWSLWQTGHRITKWDTHVANQLYYNARAREYWATKYDHFPLLDYEAMKMAYKSTSLFYQLRVPKWIGRRLPVGNRVAQWSLGLSSACPRCGVPNEDHSHVIACQHPGAIAIATKWLEALDLWLAQQYTHPKLRLGILSLLKSSFRGSQWRPSHTSDQAITAVYQKQQHQGNKNVMFGWWDKSWAETQHLYFLSISRRTTGRRWLSRLIKKQWEVSWDMWRHRMEIAATSDSFVLATSHESINIEIQEKYRTLQGSYHLPHLRRWFRQPVQVVLQQTLTFKQDWLTMVRSFQAQDNHHD
jgi:hypothetical protein